MLPINKKRIERKGLGNFNFKKWFVINNTLIVTPLIGLVGVLIGSYITGTQQEHLWIKSQTFQEKNDLFKKRLDMIAKTADILTKSALAKQKYNEAKMYEEILKLEFNSSSKILEILKGSPPGVIKFEDKTDVSLDIFDRHEKAVNELTKITCEFNSVMIQNCLYFGPKTKKCVKLFVKDNWWEITAGLDEELVAVMMSELEYMFTSS